MLYRIFIEKIKRTLIERELRVLFDKILSPKNMKLEEIYVHIAHFYKKYLKYIVGNVPEQKMLLDAVIGLEMI